MDRNRSENNKLDTSISCLTGHLLTCAPSSTLLFDACVTTLVLFDVRSLSMIWLATIYLGTCKRRTTVTRQITVNPQRTLYFVSFRSFEWLSAKNRRLKFQFSRFEPHIVGSGKVSCEVEIQETVNGFTDNLSLAMLILKFWKNELLPVLTGS